MTSIGLAAITAALIAVQGGTTADRPITLVAKQDESGLHLQVLGSSPVAMAARFTLETRSGGNHSVQKGNARLQPGQPVSLTTVNLSKADSWSAVLRVEPEGGEPYNVRLPAA